MDHLVAPANNDSRRRNCRGRIKGKLSLRVLIVPYDLLLLKIYTQHLITERPVIRYSRAQRRRRGRVISRRDIEHFFTVRDSNGAKQLIAAGDEGHALCNTGRRMHWSIGLESPVNRTVT